MKRVLIIGNSHAGAIKLGWDSAPREDLAVTFLVAPQRHLCICGLILSRIGGFAQIFRRRNWRRIGADPDRPERPRRGAADRP